MVNSSLVLVVKILASVGSMALCLSPAPSTYTIYKQKKTGDFEFLPLAIFLLCCHEWMLYGYVTQDIFPLCSTFMFGDLMGVVYIAVFIRWTSDKKQALRLLATILLAVAVTTIYAVLGKTGHTNQSASAVQDTMGYVTIAATVLLYLSPLTTVGRVLRTKNATSIPVALCAAGFVENAFWLIYGVMESDVFIWSISIYCVLFTLFQVVLYLMFTPKKTQDFNLEIDLELAKLSALSRSSTAVFHLQASPTSH